MKTMNCKQLGGACDKEFHAETFEEMAKLSKNHGMEMREDEDHMEAMDEMMKLMQDPEAIQKWMDKKREEFNSLPDE